MHFSGKLKQKKDGSGYLLELERPYLGSSNRFTRKFGSKRIIQIRLEKNLGKTVDAGSSLITYCQKPLLIFGRVFRAFYAKEGRVFFFQTNETVQLHQDGAISIQAPTHGGQSCVEMSFLDFINWHNPLQHNNGQVGFSDCIAFFVSHYL